MKKTIDNFEKQLVFHLKKYGFITPDKEIDEKDKDDSIDIPPIPDAFKEPEAVLKRGYVHKNYETTANSQTSEQLARAARNGKSLPKEILDKMRQDRNSSRDEKK